MIQEVATKKVFNSSALPLLREFFTVLPHDFIIAEDHQQSIITSLQSVDLRAS